MAEGGSQLPTSSASRTDSSSSWFSNERFSLTACVQYPRSITYAGRWFLPPSILPSIYQTWPHSILAFPSLSLSLSFSLSCFPLPRSFSCFPRTVSLPSIVRAATRSKKARGTLYVECSCLLPTPKISQDSSNHPVHPSATCTVVLSFADNHL